MDNITINLKDLDINLDIQGIDMGPVIKPIFTNCPKCNEPCTYLGPTNCQICGTLISLEEKGQERKRDLAEST